MHPKVKEAYTKAGFPIPATPAEANEELFRRRTKRAKDEDVKVYINQVWRASQGPKKDFIFYEKREVIPDLVGNDNTLTTLEGRYSMPKFRNVYDNATGDSTSIQISGYETVYDIPYSPEKMREILESGDSTNTSFVLILGTTRYGSFTAEDFVERSFEELTQIAKYGNVTPRETLDEQEYRRGSEITAELQQKQIEQLNKEQEAAAEQAKERLARLQELQNQENERLQQQQEEEANKRQEAVNKETGNRIVVAEATARYDKEGEGTQSNKRPEDQPGYVRPERQQINEEVSFVLNRREDQDVNEEEEIAKGFEQEEKSSSANKKSGKKQQQRQQQKEE